MPPEQAAATPNTGIDDDPDAESALVPAAPLRGPSGARCSLQSRLYLGGLLLATLAAALVARSAWHRAEAQERGLILPHPKAKAQERLLLQPCMKDLEGTQIDKGFFAKIEGDCGEEAAGPKTAPPGVDFLGGDDDLKHSERRAEQPAEAEGGLRWEVMAEELNVRSLPNLDAETLGKKSRGETFFGEMQDGWVKLTPGLGPGQYAYVKVMWEDVYLISPAVRGNMSQCANAGRNCSESRCCRWPGHTCFKKNDFWSLCRGSCAEGGPDPTSADSGPWSCERLGETTPGSRVDGELHRPVAGWVQDTCAADSDSCSESRCCSKPGFQCYERKRGEAFCRRKCPGDGWTCKELGARTPPAAGSGLAAASHGASHGAAHGEKRGAGARPPVRR